MGSSLFFLIDTDQIIKTHTHYTRGYFTVQYSTAHKQYSLEDEDDGIVTFFFDTAELLCRVANEA